MNLIDPALAYLRAGLCVLPAHLAEKHPALASWKEFQSTPPTEQQIQNWFVNAPAMCVVTGAVSGNLEMIDFDQQAELFDAWCALVREHEGSLLDRLLGEASQSGGRHVIYRVQSPVPTNDKLAQRKVFVDGADQAAINGKRYKPRKEPDGRWSVIITLIETRGEGGLFLCAPSPGYEILQGTFVDLPVLTAEERELLIDAARSLNEHIPQPDARQLPAALDGQRPGDDFNRRGDVRELLTKHGWVRVRSGENEHWRRPGKNRGCSATLKDGLFYVFSSNAAPFDCNKAYSPFGVFAQLECDGDFARAAAQLAAAGFGTPTSPAISPWPDETAPEPTQVLTFEQLLEYSTDNDPNTLIGDRWLCRGGSCLIVGPTGIGKSSFSMQAVITWALGEALFGLTPVRPLRSLVVQAENDIGDLSEMLRGVLRGTGAMGRVKELRSMVTFITEASRVGKSFHKWIHGLIQKYQPDLVWIDPLFAFLGGSASDQETVSKFLRNGLGQISQQTGVVWMIVHHTNKPAKDPEQKTTAVASDYAYLSSGSSELANWPRAVLTLQQVQNGLFELSAPKRGKRAGLVDANGQPATEIYLKHGDHGICWERSIAGESERIDSEEEIAGAIIEEMKPGTMYSKREIRQLVEDEMGVVRQTVLTKGKRANRVLQILMERTADPQQPSIYHRRIDEDSKTATCHEVSPTPRDTTVTCHDP
jgi:hypothetical protein